MLWYDAQREEPPAAFIMRRGVIKEIERLERIRLAHGSSFFSSSRRAILTFTDGSIARRPFDFSNTLERYIGREVVVWHDSHMDPDVEEMCFAELWDREVKANYQQIEEDRQKSVEAWRQYILQQYPRSAED